jgi:hypothetical protein
MVLGWLHLNDIKLGAQFVLRLSRISLIVIPDQYVCQLAGDLRIQPLGQFLIDRLDRLWSQVFIRALYALLLTSCPYAHIRLL